MDGVRWIMISNQPTYSWYRGHVTEQSHWTHFSPAESRFIKKIVEKMSPELGWNASGPIWKVAIYDIIYDIM
jgi:hypothetical protein